MLHNIPITHQVASDNTDLACAFIQKTVVEQVSQEIDKKLAEEYELRATSRQQGRRWVLA